MTRNDRKIPAVPSPVMTDGLSRRALLSLIGGTMAGGALGAPLFVRPAGAMTPATAADVGRDMIMSGEVASGSYAVIRLDGQGVERWQAPIPTRAHGVLWHGAAGRIVAVGRRPGFWMAIFDAADGRKLLHLEPPEGRHFQGHGLISPDGRRLYTTENAFDEERGVVGVWDLADSGRRLGEVPAGVGLHGLCFMPDGRTLGVAVGGVLTHPDLGRVKLNLDSMKPALLYVDSHTGTVEETVTLGPERHQLGIRHIAVSADGLVCAALQDEGPAEAGRPLLLVHRRGSAPVTPPLPPAFATGRLRGYSGDVVIDPAGRIAAISCPRGNAVLAWNPRSGDFLWAAEVPDVCPIAMQVNGAILTAGGDGAIRSWLDGAETDVRPADPFGPRFDNHMSLAG